MARSKKTARVRRSAEDDQAALEGADILTGAVLHGGKTYDPKKGSDQRAFRTLVEEEGLALPGAEDKSESHQEQLQHLADEGAVKGYGTEAPAEEEESEPAEEES